MSNWFLLYLGKLQSIFQELNFIAKELRSCILEFLEIQFLTQFINQSQMKQIMIYKGIYWKRKIKISLSFLNNLKVFNYI